MRKSIGILLLVGAVLSGSASVATAQAGGDRVAADASNEEARMHFDVARRFYDMGHFVEAAREFETAYSISHLVTLQYNLYLAYRDGGDDAHAAAALRLYVESLDERPRRAQLMARLRVLESRLETATQERARTDGAAGTSDLVETDTQEQDPIQDVAAIGAAEENTQADTGSSEGGGAAPWIVVSAGGALVLGAVVTGVMANGEQSTLDDLCPTRDTCMGNFESVRTRGKTLALTTDLLWISGAAAIGTGLFWAMLSGGHPDTDTRADLSCDGTGCQATVHGEF